MAEGGHFGYEDPDLDYYIDRDEKEVNTTRPFQPGTASTPYHRVEQVEMETMQHEQSGLPPSYEETSFGGDQRTPLLGAQQASAQSWDALTRIFPNASASSLETTYGPTRKLQVKMVGLGKKVYNLFTKDIRTKQDHLNPQLSKKIKNALGKRAEQIITEDCDTIQEWRQTLEEAENQQREAEAIAAEREKELREMENLKQQTERVPAWIDALKEEHGSNLESEAEL